MSTTITFSGFSPEHPEGRDFDIWKRMPAKKRGEDTTQDLRRVINCIQEIVNLLLIDIDRFPNLADPDQCSDEQIDAMLVDMGNPFDWAGLFLTPTQRRKLLLFLVEIYKSKGTIPGIENTVLFLLGEEITVVPYMADGWVLGVDSLGEGNIAQIGNFFVGPYDFDSIPEPWTLTFSVDSGVGQVVTFEPGDFVDPANATVNEVMIVIEAQLSGAGVYKVNDGEPAVIVGDPGPYNLVGGEALRLLDQGVFYEVVFQASDFETPGAATIGEVITVLSSAQIPGLVFGAELLTGGLGIASLLHGEESTIISVNDAENTASVPLGIALGTVENGVDGERLYVYSDFVEAGASIECTTVGTSVDSIFGFFMDPESATGGSVLAPSDSYTLYSFDIETTSEVDADTTFLIRKIANYMKCAHEHLVNIRTAKPLPWPDGWQLGVGQLDLDAELTQ